MCRIFSHCLAVVVVLAFPIASRSQLFSYDHNGHTLQTTAFLISDATDSQQWANRKFVGDANKIDWSLRAIMAQGGSAAAGYASNVQFDQNGNVLVYVFPASGTSSYQLAMADTASQHPTAFDTNSPVTYWIKPSALGALAGQPYVGSIRPVLGAHLNATTPPEYDPDKIIRSKEAKDTYPTAKGQNVTVGILSDDIGMRTSETAALAASPEAGEAGGVQVLDDNFAGRRTHEGCAIKRLIKHIACKADIVFAEGASSQTMLAAHIRALADGYEPVLQHTAKKCQVICDDITFLDEPYFEEGPVATAIREVTNKGVVYVTSAGNFARDVHSFQFKPMKFADSYGSYTVHDFDKDAFYDPIFLPAGKQLDISLQWDDHPYTQAKHIYNLFLYDIDTRKVIRRTKSSPNSVMHTVQSLYYKNETGRGLRLGVMVVLADDLSAFEQQQMVLVIHSSDRLLPPFYNNGVGSVLGHAKSKNAITVGAISVYNQVPGQPKKSWKCRAVYSSRGVRLMPTSVSAAKPLYDKPDIMSVDQVKTNVPGFRIFSGTSAAAAHTAGLAAMLISYNRDTRSVTAMDPTTITDALKNGAAATNLPPDHGGHGRTDAVTAIEQLGTPLHP